ncbi:MAG: NUDIX hydrolase [Runella slithyformis]|nr:MAG: NUDIX hydrolase [Runella slithyformis]TAF27722.1 MAG: NUDIX hydrolase [Runella slithyformis]TAF44600.1 MAG: NUDIX hydrolase [Runella slithyformis]TAF80887.1 MAG: NUDIX hydrolase [Runella slithyformis]
MRVRPAALIVEKKHVLLLRYRYGDSDVFALPGGNPDRGETLIATLERELREELGVEIELKAAAFYGETLLPHLKEDVLHCIFWVEIISGLPRLNPQETTALEVVWKPIGSLSSLKMYPNVGQHIQTYWESASPLGYVGKIEQDYFG